MRVFHGLLLASLACPSPSEVCHVRTEIGHHLDNAYQAAISPDGLDVVAISRYSGPMVVMRRNSQGELSFLEVYRAGEQGVTGLRSPTWAEFSADGAFLYVATRGDNSVTVFSRDASTGHLEFLETHQDGQSGVFGLSHAICLHVSGDGRSVYALGFWDNTLVVFDRDPLTGRLTYRETHQNLVGGVAGMEDPQYFSLSPDDRDIYVPGTEEDCLVWFQRNAVTGALTYAGTIWDGINGFDLYEPHRTILSQDGRDLYVISIHGNAVAHIRRDVITGSLTYVDAYQAQNGSWGLFGASHVIISPDGIYLYVSNEYEDSVIVFSRNPGTGVLTYLTTLWDGDVGGLLGPEYMLCSPNGDDLYVMNQSHRTTHFKRLGNGHLEAFGAYNYGPTDGLGYVFDVAASHDGANLYLVGYEDNSLVTLSLDDPSSPEFVDIIRSTPGPSYGLVGVRSVHVSRDDRTVFTVSPSENSLSAFSRNPDHGTLSFQDAVFDGVNGMEGLAGAIDVVSNSDGRFVYVAAYDDSAVGVFEMAGTTLEHIQTAANGIIGVTGPFRPRSLACSPDDRQIYVAGANALSLLARDNDDGCLDYRESYIDGIGSVYGLSGANGTIVSPDGHHVYASSGLDDDAILTFDRNPLDGTLQFKVAFFGSYQPGMGSLCFSENGATLLAIASDRERLFVFRRDAASGWLTADSALGFEPSGIATYGLAFHPLGHYFYSLLGAENRYDVFFDWGNALTCWSLSLSIIDLVQSPCLLQER